MVIRLIIFMINVCQICDVLVDNRFLLYSNRDVKNAYNKSTINVNKYKFNNFSYSD